VSNRGSRLETDFGRLVRGRPATVLVARTEADVSRALVQARQERRPITVRGAGHSVAGQTVTDGGILLLNRGASQPARLDGDRVEVEGRARWRQVERVINRAGRTVPVLADYLDLTVGGTLSVGGYGVESVEHGAQADHVERLRLVLPDGRAVWCSAAERAELFRFALAGLGQVGVIERAVLRTVPHRRFVTLFVYRHQRLEGLIDSIRWLAEEGASLPAFFKALMSRGRVISVYGVPADSWREARRAVPPRPLQGRAWAKRLVCVKYRECRSLAVSLWLSRFPGYARAWSDYLLDYAGLQTFGRLLQQAIERDAFAGCLRSVYLVAIRRVPRVVSFPFEASDGLTGPMAFGIGLYSMIPPGHPGRITAVQTAGRQSLAAVLSAGGRPYRYGWHELSEATRRAVYGDAHDRLAALREEMDPDHVFQPERFPLRG
jgi:FAD/FMN-containing dehydrogenase